MGESRAGEVSSSKGTGKERDKETFTMKSVTGFRILETCQRTPKSKVNMAGIATTENNILTPGTGS